MYRAAQGLSRRGFSDSGKRKHAAGRILVAPEGVELRGPAHGAQIRRVDSPPGYAGFLKLQAIGGRQVDVPTSLPSELRRHLRAHLVTALSDAGTDGRVQVFGARAEATDHGGDSFARDARHRTPPAGVDRGHGAPRLVRSEERRGGKE